MSFKFAVDYLNSLKKELERCVEAGQYSEQYLKGYEGAISCLEFAAKEHEMPKPVRPARPVKRACVNPQQTDEEDIVVCGLEELVADLVKTVRVLALYEGIGL